MKIGIDCRLYSPKYTGIGRYVFELIKQLAEIDKENEYILFFNQPEFDAFPLPNERWQKRLVNIPHYSFAEQTKFYDQLSKEAVDVMYFPHFNAPIRYKKPFVVTIHDLTLHYYPYKEYKPKWSLKKQFQIWVYRFLMGQTVKHAKHIVAVSDNTKKDLLNEYAISEAKISTILEGVPEHFQKASEQQISEMKKDYNISKPYLLYTGVWRSHKNLLSLIKAFKLLKEQGKDLQLVMTGKMDPAYPEIPSLIKELGLENDVVLTGFVSEEDLIALNSAAEVFVFPSLYEGFGLPPLEAMQFGVPVACSNTSSLPQVCADAALYFDPTKPEEIAHEVSKILDDPSLKAYLIKSGKKNVERFSWKAMAAQILDLLAKKCDNSRQTKNTPRLSKVEDKRGV